MNVKGELFLAEDTHNFIFDQHGKPILDIVTISPLVNQSNPGVPISPFLQDTSLNTMLLDPEFQINNIQINNKNLEYKDTKTLTNE